MNEDYDYLWAVHSFDVEKFEFSVVLFLLLSSLCEDSFYWGPARANFDSSLFWNCIFTTEKNSRAGISILTLMNFHEPLEIKCNFQRPSSSDSPLIARATHTSSVGRFSENVDDKVVTYLIFFVWTHWFQKCNFWKNSLGPFWGRRGRWGQTTSKLKTVKILNENSSKIDEIQILASATSKMTSWPQRPQKGLNDFFQKLHF